MQPLYLIIGTRKLNFKDSLYKKFIGGNVPQPNCFLLSNCVETTATKQNAATTVPGCEDCMHHIPSKALVRFLHTLYGLKGKRWQTR